MAKIEKGGFVMTPEKCVADEVLGRFARQQHDWFERVRKGSLDPEEVMRVVQDIIDRPDPVFPVTIDYTQTITEMVSSGHYDRVNEDITAERFPVTGEGVVEAKLELVHFNRSMESEEVLKEFAKAGLEPARIEHLLAFGANHPELQRQFPIIALGSVWQYRRGYGFVPFLWGSAGARDLRLYWFERGWRDFSRFLALRK